MPIIFNMKIAILIILFMFPNVTHACDRYNSVVKFDRYFSKYSKRYFGLILTRGRIGWCVETHDLAASKLTAFNSRDVRAERA